MFKIKVMISMSELLTIQRKTYHTWIWPLETVDLILSSNVLDSAPQVARTFNKKIAFHNILRLSRRDKCVAKLIPHAVLEVRRENIRWSGENILSITSSHHKAGKSSNLRSSFYAFPFHLMQFKSDIFLTRCKNL